MRADRAGLQWGDGGAEVNVGKNVPKQTDCTKAGRYIDPCGADRRDILVEDRDINSEWPLRVAVREEQGRELMAVVRMMLCLPRVLWEAVQARVPHEGDANAVIIRAVEDYLAGAHKGLGRDQPGKYQELITRLSVPIADLKLSARAATCLRQLNIQYAYDLVEKSPSDLLRQKNFGQKSFREIRDKLAALGLRFEMTLDGPTYADAVTAAVVAGMKPAAEASSEGDDSGVIAVSVLDT
jgi:hypothetical protein